ELVGARSGHHVDDRTRHVAVFDAEWRVVDLEFLDTRNRRLETERAECQIIGADPVDMERGGFLAIAGRVDGDGTYAPKGCRREPRLRGRNRAWCQQREVGEVPTVERNLLHRVRCQDVAHAAGHTIDERDVRPDDNRFGRVTDLQTEIPNER